MKREKGGRWWTENGHANDNEKSLGKRKEQNNSMAYEKERTIKR